MNTTRLSKKIVQGLRKEAVAWDRARSQESEAEVTAELERAEIFKASRPPREPVSVRLDPRDVFLLKRLARRQGIPYSQLLAQWVHERVLREAKRMVG